jgi:quinone-modifying oxidoreductase subunit QmoC
VESAEQTTQEIGVTEEQERPGVAPAPSESGDAVWIDPDLGFIRAITHRRGDTFKTCIQCGTCSGTCTLTPDSYSFPCKEMAWVSWGMRDRLLTDPDVWLCYQCNDCSSRCPRGAQPGEVLGAIREACVQQYAFPRFFAKWVSQPQFIPLLLGIPIALLSLALALKDPIADALGIERNMGVGLSFSYSSVFPHWLLNSFFFLFSALALIAAIVGVRRFWRALKAGAQAEGAYEPVKDLGPSVRTALKKVFTHDNFGNCEKAHTRLWSHFAVLFGFLALCVVTLWVITSGINPLIRDDFVYPFGFWSPWKILANLGGLAVLAGCCWMIGERIKDSFENGYGTYFDWALLSTLLLVVLTGFFTEVLHYVRLEPHRHLVYFLHLVFVFALLIYLPYSKLAHVMYRTTALVFAEHTGRKLGDPPATAGGSMNIEKE